MQGNRDLNNQHPDIIPFGEEKNLTFKQNMSRQEAMAIFKAVILPIITFVLGLFVISNLANYGKYLICPLAGVMWLTGLIVAIIMPGQREEVLNQTLVISCIYFIALIGLKGLLGLLSGVSAEMIMASFDQAMPTATGNAIPGYVQTMMWFVAVLVPVGNIGMQVKRVFQFKKTQSLHKAFGQARGLRNDRNEHTRLRR